MFSNYGRKLTVSWILLLKDYNMRVLAIIDTKIDKDEALAMLEQYNQIWKDNVGDEITYWVERKDFTSVPTVPDADGDLKPNWGYRQELTTEVHKRYGDYGVDDIIWWVHEDNFLFKGIWGTAWSYVHYKYNLLLCRWDKKNPVNTLNTLFHEGVHPLDTLLPKELGVDINEVLKNYILKNFSKRDRDYVLTNGFDIDRDYVHGGLPSMPYIGQRGYVRNKTNLELLKVCAPYIRKAHQKRKDKHFAPVMEVQNRFIGLLKSKIKKLLANLIK